MSYENILVTKEEGKIAVCQLNRPAALNALNIALMTELVDALETLDKDPDVCAIIITGNDKAFAAGADIKEMATASAMEMLTRDQFARWDRIRKLKTPLVAAVSGFALGGGCELAMHCDIIVASETARFAQPEVNIGVMPGAGGTQRLTRTVGKSKAMEIVLTGKMFSAMEMMEAGLVARVYSQDVWLDEAKALAREIASKPPIAIRLAKEAVLKAFDTTIEMGLEYERKNFYLLFASDDMREGMNAFIEKRKPVWKGK